MAHTDRDAVGRPRKMVFWGWVVASIIVTVYLLVGAPFTEYFQDAQWIIAVGVPALMFFFLATGLGWLIYLSSARGTGQHTKPTRTGPRLDMHREHHGRG